MSVIAVHQKQRALGSICEIVLVGPVATLNVRFASLWRDILLFEKRFSRFLPSSELSHINERAGLETGISGAMYDILSAAKHASALTNNRYNPFILPALQRAGYVGSRVPGDTETDAPDYRRRIVAHPSELMLTKAVVTIPYNSALDLGGIGKGYLAQQLQRHPALHGLQGFWISLGGDVIGGGTDENDMAWKVAVSTGDEVVSMLTMPADVFSLATSGTTLHRGNNWHHIIDTSTGKSVQGAHRSATIMHDSPTLADVLASLAVDPKTSDEELLAMGATGILRTLATGELRAVGTCQQEALV